ncbi:MAG: tetratricopeptide repeat protein [Bernardetiaceae bacterium]|nr:tetratricopeptide repeat protein [Bernardetiaceae bacterium]
MDKIIKKAADCYREEKYTEAIKLYTQALEVQEDAELYYQRAMCHLKMGDLFESVSDMDAAQILEPQNPYRYSSRAYVKALAGKVMSAIKDYEKAIEIDPEDAIAHNNLGLLQERIGNMNASKRSFNIADELEKEGKLLGSYTSIEKQNGESPQQSREEIKKEYNKAFKKPQRLDDSFAAIDRDTLRQSFKNKKFSANEYAKAVGEIFSSKDEFQKFLRNIKAILRSK